jgi:hypothetical protein
MRVRYPVLTTSPKNKFAHEMLTVVFPKLIQNIVDSGVIRSKQVLQLERLRASITLLDTVPVMSPAGMTPPEAWKKVRGYDGMRWTDLPSYAAESLFYCMLLQSTGFFDAGSEYFSVDPFLVQKIRDLARGLPSVTFRYRRATSARELLVSSLWGNLSDSAHLQSDAKKTDAEHEILVDESPQAIKAIAAARQIAVLADNAGRELLSDLLLIIRILRDNQDACVTIYLKEHPYFVSDATLNDFETTRVLLAENRCEELDLTEHLRLGKLRPKTHWFFHSPLHYSDCPDDLREELNSFDVLIFKGDLHYRRLVSDRVTPADTSLRDLIPRFRPHLVLLRTLKSDICAGLPAATVASMRDSDPSWKYSGRYGVIHYLPGTKQEGARQ